MNIFMLLHPWWLLGFVQATLCPGRARRIEDWHRWSESTSSSCMAKTRSSRVMAAEKTIVVGHIVNARTTHF